MKIFPFAAFHKATTSGPRILPLILSVAACGVVAAAPYRVEAEVVEKASGSPCVEALYRIYSSSDTTKAVAYNVTDADGRISQSLSRPGSYLLRVEYAGLKTLLRDFSVSASEPVAGLGQLSMEEDDGLLQEVVVTAKKKLVTSDGATLTYNVEDDPEASVNTTLEMLRKVPMVTVDAEENIRINGNTNFKILVNGKEDPMLSGDVKSVLKAMPAATIKKFEVITDPGAKYDAEGTGGILNIITTGKQRLEGYMANLSANAGKDYYGASFYGRTKLRNVTASANFNFNQPIDRGYRNSSESTLENLTPGSESTQTTTSRSKYNGSYLGGNFNLSWEPDTLNLFTVQGNVGRYKSESWSRQQMEFATADASRRWSLNRDFHSDGSYMWLGANSSYQHTFGRQGHHIILSYIFSYNSDHDDERALTYDMAGISEEFPLRLTSTRRFARRSTFQLDYANPFTEKHLLEAGLKGNWQRDHQNSIPYYGSTDADLHPGDGEQVRVRQFQDILAAYCSYTGNYGKWSTRLGLRYEYTHMGLDYSVGDYTDFTTDLSDLVPNASLTYRFGGASNLRLAYQMRISRPSISRLSPYRDTMNPNQVSYGNPDLETVKGHNISLSYSNYGGRLGGSVSLNYRREDNAISDYQFFQDGILNTTYANIGHEQGVGGNMNLQWSILPTLNVGVNLSGGYLDMKASSPQLTATNHGWTGNYSFNADYTFPFRLRLSVYAGGGTGWMDLQSKGNGYSYHNLSISRSFLKEDRLTLSAFASGFLQPHRKSRYTQVSETSRYENRSRYESWFVGASVSFRLGSLRADVKRTDADIDAGGANAPSSGSGR